MARPGPGRASGPRGRVLGCRGPDSRLPPGPPAAAREGWWWQRERRIVATARAGRATAPQPEASGRPPLPAADVSAAAASAAAGESWTFAMMPRASVRSSSVCGGGHAASVWVSAGVSRLHSPTW